ncbi:MFS transporter [Pochonia chlamydosporia 170]|uniref:MFS transporter n=1 Tax=Pochonia chlamydosporia 170 TaxID=1380566 RepID=A0A179FG96_METCM|nr:MFS transporter [Pochonia chlamydosporia 170]OAQ64368.2 MFS transporter [Pochonia chlamydosporia 170]
MSKQAMESALGAEHHEYLVQKHGTTELNPVPHMDDADPLNWPKYKKITNLALVSFNAMMALFTAASIQAAFVDISKDLGVSVQRASYLTSLFIAIIGAAPLFWRPLSHTYGRRPIFLVSLLCSLVGNVGCAVSPTYATMGLCRAITAFFISPASSIGSAVVSESFFRHERGRYIGIWTVMVTLGVPVAPLVFGFVAFRVGYRWIYWTLAITNAVQFLLYMFLGSETRYVPNAKPLHQYSRVRQLFGLYRIDPSPLDPKSFISPLRFTFRICVSLAAVSYAMIFLWGCVMTSLEMPQIFPEKFGLNTEQVGLQNIGLIVGTILGEQIGGFASDKWMWTRELKGRRPDPEFRLWLSHIGHLLTICGVVVFFVQLDRASDTWNVTPVVGTGIAAAGNQIVTTVMITYAVDCYPEDAAGIGVFVTLVRQTWGFIGPFWFPQMIENIGYARSTAVSTAMIVGVSILPTVLLQWRGRLWRGRGDEKGEM